MFMSPFPSPGDLPNPGTEPRSPALQADSLLSEPAGNTGVGSLSLLQGIFPTQESKLGSPALQADSLPAEHPFTQSVFIVKKQTTVSWV